MFSLFSGFMIGKVYITLNYYNIIDNINLNIYASGM